MTKATLLFGVAAAVLSGCGGAGSGSFQAWPSPIEVRAYPGAFSREPDVRRIDLTGLAGEVLSAQVIVKSSANIRGLSGAVSDLAGDGGAGIPAGSCRVRYGAYLPVDETMTLTADPLLEGPTVDVPANTAQSVWVTIEPPADIAPGRYAGSLAVKAKSGEKADFELTVEILPAVMPAATEWGFYLNIWQDPSGVARAHKVEDFSEEHWRLLEKYAADFAAHGMRTITTSIVYDPWDSQSGYPFQSMVEWKYPGEYSSGKAAAFSWDFTNFDRYVELMMAAGIREKIDCFSLVKGPGRNQSSDIRYLDTTTNQYRTAEITIGDPEWREVWSAFLPVLRRHLQEKSWFERATLSFDEKPDKFMRMIFDLVIERAPDFRISIAGGGHYPGDKRKQADEISLYHRVLENESEWKAMEPLVKRMRADKDRYVTFYTACQPALPNVFLYSPLRESRLLPWMAWKFGLDGYLRWASNAFPEDVWTQPNYKWHSGDMYFVYPGPDGPLDGMRWELMRQGIQDYEALRIAWDKSEKAGRKDLLKKLDAAVATGTVISSCNRVPFVGEARAMVDEVIRELGG